MPKFPSPIITYVIRPHDRDEYVFFRFRYLDHDDAKQTTTYEFYNPWGSSHIEELYDGHVLPEYQKMTGVQWSTGDLPLGIDERCLAEMRSYFENELYLTDKILERFGG